MKLWRDVGDAMTEALIGDWRPRNIVTFYRTGPGGQAMAVHETAAGRRERRLAASGYR